MATYEQGEFRKPSKKGPIPVTDSSFNTEESWEGRDLQEIEDYLCRCINKLAESASGKITLTICDAQGNPASPSINFADGADDVRFYFKVSYTQGEEFIPTCRCIITMNGQYVGDYNQNKYISFNEDTVFVSPNIAPYLAANNSATNVLTIRAYDIDENGDAIATPGQKTVSFNRIVSTLALEGMTFAQVNPITVNFKSGFIPNENSPKAYLRYRCIKPDNTSVSYTDLTTGEISDYREVEVSANNEVSQILLSNIIGDSQISGAYTIVAVLYSGRTNNDLGIQSNTVVYNFLYVADDVADGTHFIIVDNIPDAVQNDYVDVNYKVYVKGYDGTYKTPLLLQDSINNAWVTESIKYIGNNQPYTWRYFVPSLASIGQSACSLRFAVPQMVDDTVTLVDGVYKITDDTVVYRNGAPIAVTSNGKSKTVSFTPSASNVNWSAMSSLFHFNFRNKENTDYDKDTIVDNGYKLVLEDVKYSDKGSGYTSLTIDGTTSNVLKLIGNSKGRIYKPNNTLFTPFYDATPYNSTNSMGGGILGKGRTLKITFAVSNISDPNKKIIDCFDPNSGLGFYVTGNAIYLRFNEELVSKPEESFLVSGHNDRRFSEMKRIELCVTIQPYYVANGVESAHEIRFYVNGELAGFRKLSNDITSMSQLLANATPIVFGGTGAVLYLYDVKFAEAAITPYQVLQDYCMGFDNSETLNEFYLKEFGSTAAPFYSTRTNDVTGEVSTFITIENALNYGKWLASKDITDFAVFITTNACNAARYMNNTEEHAQEAESLYLFRFKKDAQGNGIIDPELSLYIEGYNDDENQTWEVKEGQGALRMRRQGTSTASGTIGNIRWDTRGTCLLHRWNPDTQRFFDAYTKIKKKAELFYIPNADAIPCFLVTAKKNVNESTHARNVPVAKWFEACSRAVAAADQSKENILTPPQIAEFKTIQAVYPNATRQENINRIKTRQVIDGITSIGFEIPYTKDALGKYAPVLDPANTFRNTAVCLGQYDLTTDKKNMKIFGFGGHTEWYDDEGTIKTKWVKDAKNQVTLSQSLIESNPDILDYELVGEDFSIEFKDHVDLCAFRTPDFNAGNANKNFEYRYPEEYVYYDPNDLDEEGEPKEKSIETLVSGVTIGLTPSGPMHNIFDLVATCDLERETSGYYVNGVFQPALSIPTIEQYNGANFLDDSVDNRKRLFRNELKYYAVVDQFLIYYIATLDFPLGVDQEGKNLFLGRYGNKNLQNGTEVSGDSVTVNGVVRQILRILGYDYDTNLRLDNRNNFKFLYTEMYKDHNFDEGGSPLWDLIEACFEPEIKAMKSMLYGSLLTAEVINNITGKRTNGIMWYLFENHISHYNSTQYNVNADYCYTSIAADYPKSHGSAKEDIEWFVRGRFKFISGLGFDPSVNANDVNSDFAKSSEFFVYPSSPSALGDDANYKNMMGHWPDEAGNYNENSNNTVNIFKLDFTCYERNTVGIRIGSGSWRYASVFSNVTPVIENDIITGYTRENSSLKLAKYFTPSDDFSAFMYGTAQVKTIAGLEKWYIRQIRSWGELTNVEELILGSTAMLEDAEGNPVPYRNARLSNLSLGSVQDGNLVIFGSCKKLNLAGCSNIATIDLNSFPVLEVFEGLNMDGTRQVTLPVGNSMQKIHYPTAQLENVVIDNKPNLSEIWFGGVEAANAEGLNNLTEVSVTDSSQYAARQAINLLIKLNN